MTDPKNDETVTDGASTTDHYTGDEIANGAADALHGGNANVEKHEQPPADALESRTLIADAAPGETDGERPNA
jgi:hypothetical protein